MKLFEECGWRLIEEWDFQDSRGELVDEDIRHCLLKIQRSSETLHTQEKGVIERSRSRLQV